MALVVGKLVAQLEVEDSDYRRGMAQAKRTAQDTERTIGQAGQNAGARFGSGVGAGMGRARQEMGSTSREAGTLAQSADRARSAVEKIGIGFSAAGLVAGIRAAVMAASDLSESTNAVDVSFGESAGRIKDWAAGAAKSLGQSNVEARNAAATMALYGKQADLSGDNLANFAIKMSTLASDMASFRNTSPEQAVEALGAAFRGESDPIEAYGVLLNETTLKNQAMRDGLISNTSDALDPATRVQAVYNAVLSQTSIMQGDFQRTSGGLANQMRILRAEAINAAAGFGDKLLPVAQGFVSLLAGPGMAAVGGFGDVLGGVASVIGHLTSAFGSLPGPIQAAIAAVVGLRLAKMMLGNQIDAVGGKLSGLRTHFQGYTQQVDNMQRASRVAGGDMSRLGAHIQVLGRNSPLISQMGASFVRAADGASRFPRAAGTASAAMTGMKGAASGLMGALGGPWGLAIAGATAALGFWIAKKQKDAEASRKAKAEQDSLTDTIRQGGIEAGKAAQQQKLAGSEQQEIFKKVGVDISKVSEMINAFGTDSKKGAELYAQLRNQIATAKVNPVAWVDAQVALAGYNAQLTNGAEAAAQVKDKATQASEANGTLAVSFDRTAIAAGPMAKAMQDFNESTDGAASQVDKLKKALDQLNDDSMTQEEAVQSWSDNMRDFVSAMQEGGSAAVMLNGHVDVTTEAGSKLQNVVRDLASDYNGLASSTYQAAIASGQDVGAALDTTRQRLLQSRQAFVDQAAAITGNREEAERLANVYLGTPEQIITQLNVEGVPNAINALRNVGLAAKAIPDGQVKVIPDTAAARSELDKLHVKYSVMDGKLVITDNSPEVAKALSDIGIQAQALPGGFVKLDDNTPETKARLDELKIKYTTLPDKSIVIDAADAEFWAKVNKAMEDGKKNVFVNFIAANRLDTVGGTASASADENANGSIRQRANGMLDTAQIQNGSGQGIIQHTGQGPVRWAEGETGWEAFIPGATSKRARSLAILAEVAKRFGYGLSPIQAFAAGAIRTASQINAFPRQNGLEGAPYNWGGVHWGDCSGAMSAIARYATGQDPWGGRFATGTEASMLKRMGFNIGKGPAGSLRIGWFNGGPYGGHTAGTLPDGTNVEMGGNRGDGQVGGGAAGWDDPQFTGSAWLPVQGDNGETSGMDGTTTGGTTGGSYGVNGGTGSAQNVYVVGGHLDGSTPSTTTSPSGTPTATPGQTWNLGALGIRAYAAGGFEDHRAHITDRLRIFGEPETGGEAYIPLAPGKRKRSIDIWRETGRRLGVTEFAAGGFGGYRKDTTDVAKPRNWYDFLALGVGGAMAIESMIEPYIGMATSKQINLGQLTPQINTANNSPGALDSIVSDAASGISQQLGDILKALQDGKTIQVTVNGQDQGPGFALGRVGM